MQITKNRYLTCFAAIVFILAVVRLLFPSVARNSEANRAFEIADSLRANSLRKVEEVKLAAAKIEAEKAEKERKTDSIKKAKQAQESATKIIDNKESKNIASPFFNPDGTDAVAVPLSPAVTVTL